MKTFSKKSFVIFLTVSTSILLLFYLRKYNVKYSLYEIKELDFSLVIDDSLSKEKETGGGVVNLMTTNAIKSEMRENTIVDYSHEAQKLKYILQWTEAHHVPFSYMGYGRDVFIKKKCEYTNCFVTNDMFLLKDTSMFDVVVFAGPDIKTSILPKNRSPKQKFVFASIESAHYYPICSDFFDGYFNWTWTYRLDSEVQWGFMVIKDANNNVVGPRKDMQWIKFEDMEPVNEEFKKQLKTKTKAVAWFVSNCFTINMRKIVAMQLSRALRVYSLHIDVYGECGKFKCPRSTEADCFKMLKENYYFYLSFENANSEDYVTEKLLNAVQHDTVPIVYGGANYSRFLPNGTYLNAVTLPAEKLAAKINHLMKNPDEYAEYFRWKKYYSYHKQVEDPKTDEYCNICKILNDEQKMKGVTVYKHFQKWWDPPRINC